MSSWDGSGPVVIRGRHCGLCNNGFVTVADCGHSCHAETPDENEAVE